MLISIIIILQNNEKQVIGNKCLIINNPIYISGQIKKQIFRINKEKKPFSNLNHEKIINASVSDKYFINNQNEEKIIIKEIDDFL